MKRLSSEELLSRLDYFKKVRLFKGLNDEQIKFIVTLMKTEIFETGQFVFKEGSPGDSIYILLEGEIEISKSLVLPQWIQSAQKQEKSLLRLSEKHYPFIGEMAMFGEQAMRSASIKATRICRMAIVTKRNLLNIFEKDPEIGMVVYRNISSELATRLRKANRDILKLTTAFTLALEG